MPGPAKQYPCRIELRIDEALLTALDKWRGPVINQARYASMSRNEAIRLAIKRILKTKRPAA